VSPFAIASVLAVLAQAAAVPSYRVGPGDLLEVTVDGRPELSRTAVVQTGGAVWMPEVGDVAVAELTLPEVRRKLTSLLDVGGRPHPEVGVRLLESRSRFVSVRGEVNSPGRHPLRGRRRLIDVLVAAGGFTPEASGEVAITRREGTVDGEGRTLRVRLDRTPLTPRDRIDLEVVLEDGDVVTAEARAYATVEGEVARPGRYPLTGNPTVSGIVSSAGGLRRGASTGVTVRRVEAATGQIRTLEVDLKAIEKGRDPDVVLQPDDLVTVGARQLSGGPRSDVHSPGQA
jgi:polysaccharide biosynthesis/export protein